MHVSEVKSHAQFFFFVSLYSYGLNLDVYDNLSCTVDISKRCNPDVGYWLLKQLSLLGRYSSFQYPDQDPYPEDFNADALFHVSVPVKRICIVHIAFNCDYVILL